MRALNDYRELNHTVKLEDLSRDALIELLRLHSRLFLAMDGFWYLAVKERLGNEQALQCDIWAWEKYARHEMKKLMKLLPDPSNDVYTLMRAIQITPWMENLQYNIEITDRNNAVLTVTRCPILEALEREGAGREKDICNLVEAMIFREYAKSVNPDITVRRLKLPAKKSKEKICCQWEFKLE